MSRGLPGLAVGLVLALGAGCVAARGGPAAAPARCPGGEAGSVLSALFFGMASGDGRGVSEQAWDGFLASVVTPRFPAGLTVLSGYGQYQGSGAGAVTREGTKVLLVVHGGGRPEAARLSEIVAIYKQRFDQEAVLHVSAPVCAALP